MKEGREKITAGTESEGESGRRRGGVIKVFFSQYGGFSHACHPQLLQTPLPV